MEPGDDKPKVPFPSLLKAFLSFLSLIFLVAFGVGLGFVTFLYTDFFQRIFPRPPSAMTTDFLSCIILVFIVSTLVYIARASTLRVKPDEEAAIFRGNVYWKIVGPGKYHVTPLIDRVVKRNIRDVYSVHRERDYQTKDGESIKVKGTVNYQIVDIRKSAVVDNLQDRVAACLSYSTTKVTSQHTVRELQEDLLNQQITEEIQAEMMHIPAGQSFSRPEMDRHSQYYDTIVQHLSQKVGGGIDPQYDLMEDDGRIVVDVRGYISSDGRPIPMKERLVFEKQFKIQEWGVNILSVQVNIIKLASLRFY